MIFEIFYDGESGIVTLRLPLGRHIRIKKRNLGVSNQIVITEKRKIKDEEDYENSYIEWQIKYKVQDNNSESELKKLVDFACDVGILQKSDLKQEIKEISRVSELFNLGVNKRYLSDLVKYLHKTLRKVDLKDGTQKDAGSEGSLEFDYYEKALPNFVVPQDALVSLKEPFIFVETKTREKKKGLQSMIYACFPLKYVGDTGIIEKSVENIREVYVKLDEEKFKWLVLSLLKIFAVASKTDRDVIMEFLKS